MAYADLFDEDLDTVAESLDRVAMQTSVADLMTYDLPEAMPPLPGTQVENGGLSM